MDKEPIYLEWNDSLSIGIPELDEDHRHFLKLLQEFVEAVLDREEASMIQKRIEAILEHEIRHFGEEERLLREWGYPEVEAHVAEHARIVRTMREMRAVMDCEKNLYWPTEAAIELNRTIIAHLRNEDMKCRNYFVDQSANPANA